jgi:Tfp pilus assembly protein PilO
LIIFIAIIVVFFVLSTWAAFKLNSQIDDMETKKTEVNKTNDVRND